MTPESATKPRQKIAPIAPAPQSSGMTAERFAEVLKYLERRKGDTEYFLEWEEIAASHHREQQAQAGYEPDEEGK